jgi:hypothetical protein
MARDNLKNLKLRSEIVAQVTQTTRRHIGVTVQPEKNGPRNSCFIRKSSFPFCLPLSVLLFEPNAKSRGPAALDTPCIMWAIHCSGQQLQPHRWNDGPKTNRATAFSDTAYH